MAPTSPPTDAEHLTRQVNRSASSQASGGPLNEPSPWSSASRNSRDLLSLSLPSLPHDDLAQDPSIYDRLDSPSAFLLDRRSNPHFTPSTTVRFDPAASGELSLRSFGSAVPNQAVRGSDLTDPFSDPIHNANSPGPRDPSSRASSIVDLTESSPPIMNAQQKRRKESSRTGRRPKRLRVGSSPPSAPPSLQEGTGNKKRAIEEVDLVDIDDDEDYKQLQTKQQEELIRQQRQDEVDKPVRLSDFQCIICLDNPTDLTVTWCGHLFCSVCLHEALHAGTQKKVCPVCRQTISLPTKNPRTGKDKAPSHSVYPLSMKLMTAKKMGKQAERM